MPRATSGAGEAIDLIHDVAPAGDIVRDLVRGAEDGLASTASCRHEMAEAVLRRGLPALFSLSPLRPGHRPARPLLS